MSIKTKVEALQRRFWGLDKGKPLPLYQLCPFDGERFICYKLELGQYGPTEPYISDGDGNFIAPLPDGWDYGQAQA